MKSIKGHTKKVWYIIHDGSKVYANGELEVGSVLDTGQPFLEVFENESEYVDRCGVWGVEPYVVIPNFELPTTPIDITGLQIPTPPTIEQRLDNIEAITAEIIVNLNEKGIVP